MQDLGREIINVLYKDTVEKRINKYIYPSKLKI